VKQSPVPLPANFLAAMNSTPPTSRTIPTSQTPKSSPSLSPKSTAPVPIPKFPGMTPHQAAAQAANSPTPPHKEQGPSHDIHPRVALADATNTAQQHVADQPTGVPDSIHFSGTDSASPEWTRSAHQPVAQEFPDVPGSESMEFMEKMMANLRRVSQSGLSP
jgi:hypothetical protein